MAGSDPTTTTKHRETKLKSVWGQSFLLCKHVSLGALFSKTLSIPVCVVLRERVACDQEQEAGLEVEGP